MKKILQRGFTLIELLVVIAIIGILAAVVLASLNDARSSGSDAAIKQTLGNIRSQAEIIYNQQSFSYETVCENTDVKAMGNSAAASGPDGNTMDIVDTTVAAWNVAICHDSPQAWVVAVPVSASVSGTPTLWCVDSTGFAGIDTAIAGSAYSCN